MSVKPMLAYSKSPDPADLSYPVMVQPKIDGIRAMVIDGVLRSRTLKRIPNAEIQAALSRPEFEGLDGELILGDPRDPSCYRNTSSYVMAENKTGGAWTFYVFDLWNHGGNNWDRWHALVSMFEGDLGEGRIKVVSTVTLQDSGELERVEALYLAEGFEGAILRDPTARYKFGRSGKTGPLRKLKRYIDFEAEVVGAYEEQHNANPAMTNALGRTERSTAKAGKSGKGTLGGLICVALNGPAEGVEFRCGTGFDAGQRAMLWEIHQGTAPTPSRPVVGRTAKIKSFPIGVKDKPRHPVFLGWRDMEVDG